LKKLLLLIANLLIISKLATAQSISLATTIPVSPTKGTVVYNNSTNQLQYWNGTAWIPITNAATGTGWAASGTDIYNANTGNVGIGTTAPTTKLSIQTPNNTDGFSHISDGGIVLKEAVGGVSAAIGTYSDHTLRLVTNGTAKVNILPNGYVGIGTTSPTYPLTVVNDITGIGFSQESPDRLVKIGFYTTSNAAFVETHSNHDLNFATSSGGSRMVLQKGTGYVGIGTTSPKAPLHVGFSSLFNGGESNFFYPIIPLTHSSTSSGSVSILSDDGIISNAYIGCVQNIVFSDARIKNVVGLSNNAEDLALLRQIEITNYRMKDVVTWGNQLFKKVIAQQVESIYPEAIKKQTSTIPDIYSLAEKVVYDETNKTLKCLLSKAYDIKVGEKIEFVHEKEGKIKTEVVEVSGNSFTVKDWKYATDKIFVYGREVNDFRTVDYEAISMLGISAIQQLAKEVEELKSLNSKLKADFSARLEVLETLIVKPQNGK
jgi:hypothetical protein